MSTLVADCPRCGANKITFDATQQLLVGTRHSWLHIFEIFCICRNCHKSTVFVVEQKSLDYKNIAQAEKGLINISASLNNFFSIDSYISLREQARISPPDFLPENIQDAFNEGATCVVVQCWSAACSMFRKCVDLATRHLLPAEDVQGLNKKQRRDLGLRLQWLFDNNKLPNDLHALSQCIKEDGNDGAHNEGIKEEDAEDLLDFTVALLERLYTEPAKLDLAKKRREDRRQAVSA